MSPKLKAMKGEPLRAWIEKLYTRLDWRLGGWLGLLVRTVLAFVQDDCLLAARSIAYYALFAVFPAILALIVVASAVLGSEEAQVSVMNLVAQYAPIANDVVAANSEQLLAMSRTIGVIALIGLLWSASGVASAIFKAVNRAWGVQGARLLLSGRLYSLAMIFVVGALLLLAVAIGPIVSLVQAWQPSTDQLVHWQSTLAPAVFSVCAFVLLYRTMPRVRVEWRDVWLGGLIAGLVWEAGKRIFTWYVGNMADYNAIYGSVEAIIAFLLWCYLSGQILLLGAEFTAEYSRWRRAGRPIETRPPSEWRPAGRAQASLLWSHTPAQFLPGVSDQPQYSAQGFARKQAPDIRGYGSAVQAAYPGISGLGDYFTRHPSPSCCQRGTGGCFVKGHDEPALTKQPHLCLSLHSDGDGRWEQGFTTRSRAMNLRD